MRKIFLSYTDLYKDFINGRVSHAELANSLFMFGCSRSFIFDAWRQKDYYVIRNAVAAAEKDGRVVWRNTFPAPKGNVLKMLNSMLMHNGYASIATRNWDCRTSNKSVAVSLMLTGIDLDTGHDPEEIEMCYRENGY